MTTKEMIQKIVDLLETFPDNQSMWDDRLMVKSSPHNLICILYGAWLSPDKDVWLIESEDWHKLEPTDHNAEYVAASVLQRLKLLKAEVV